jgi:hypothetical protein
MKNIANRSFENETNLKYLGTARTNREINSKLNSENACYHSVKNILSSCLLSKK